MSEVHEPVMHVLKLWPQYMDAVLEGRKTFEVRENDRDFREGDLVQMQEWNPVLTPQGSPVGYTGRTTPTYRVGYVLPIQGTTRVVFSLLRG